MYSINQRYFIYVSVGFISLILSIWSIMTGSVINTDGVCYLQSAETLSQGLSAAVHTCGQSKWPFYSILIATVAFLFHLPILYAAYLFNTILTLISVLTFVKIVAWIEAEPGGIQKRSLLWFAGIVILLSNEFNSVRFYIIRDHGFWAFNLLSMYWLLRFFNNPLWKYSIAWTVCLLIATLFRIEGAVFLLGLPFITFLNTSLPFKSRITSFFKLTAMLMVIAAALALWMIVASPSSLGRLNELSYQITHGISQLVIDYKNRANQLAQHVLNPFAARDSIWVLFITLVAWYLVSSIKNVSFIYSFFAVFAWSKRLLRSSRATSLVLWGYIIVNVLITALFLSEYMFLSKRYLIALSLVIMIWAPFALQYFYEKWQYQKWPLALAVMFILLSSIGGIHEFGYSKKYIYDAGNWLANNTPVDAKIFSNDILVMYYSHRFGNSVFEKERRYRRIKTLKNIELKQYQYLALRLEKKDFTQKSALFDEIKSAPIQIFSNKRGDQVRIYKSTL